MITAAAKSRQLDLPLLFAAYLLASIGVVILFSATRGDPTGFYRKQIVWVLVGTLFLALMARADYHRIAGFAKWIYGINLLLLAIVLLPRFHQHGVNGAGRWIRIGGFPFQPSELAKFALIVTLAVLLSEQGERVREIRPLLVTLAHAAVPALLIFKQPDLGTALVILTIWLGMVFIAGAQIRHLLLIIAVAVALFATLWVSGRIIRTYQKSRLTAFLNPEADPKEAGYHVLQARIAIGSGGMWGKGLLHSTQVHGGYIPEKQTDFIFTDIGEELGFAGALTVTLLYGALLWRGYRLIAASDDELLGKTLCAGVISMLAFHIIVNIGMNIGVMPVAGVPLPLISSGGSNVIVTLTSLGLLESVAIHRRRMLF